MNKKVHGKIGFRYIQDIDRAKEDDVKKAHNYAAANLSDGLNKFYTMDSGIKQMYNTPKMVGTAVTVKVRAGDNLMLHKAIELIQPGDILVVETQGANNYAVAGELMITSMKNLGLVGLVVDGTVRDLAECERIGMPIFARGTVCGAGDKTGPGEINFPISCGGVVVMPGDIIVGDKDGIVVIPKDDTHDVFLAADKKIQAEKKRHEEFAKGIYIKTDTDQNMIKNGFIE